MAKNVGNKTYLSTLEADGYYRTRPPEDVTAPSLNGAMTISGVSASGFAVTWPAATDTQTGVDNYDVRIANNSGFTGATVYNTTSLTKTFSGLAAGTWYVAYRATDVAGNTSSWSGSQSQALTAPTSANFIISAGASSFNGNSATDVNGTTRAVAPGDIVQFSSGTYGSFDLTNVVGNSSQPVQIIGPSSGVATFRGDSGFVFEVTGCEYFTIDGWKGSTAADTADTSNFSIKVTYSTQASSNPTSYFKMTPSSTRKTPSNCTIRGVWIDGGWTTGTRSSHIGMQVHHNGASRVSGPFVGDWQENVIIEYCRAERCYGEGFYFGPNYSSNSIPLRNMTFRYNYMANNGRDGMQCKCWWSGTNKIHGNYVYNCGNRTDEAGQCFGLSLLSGVANIYDNWVEQSGESGIQLYVQNGPSTTESGYGSFPTFECEVYNNVVIDAGQTGPNVGHGITVGASNSTITNVTPYLYNNTLYNNQGNGINVGSNADAGWARNNIAVGNGSAGISMSVGTSTNNTTSGTPSTIFVASTSPYNMKLKSEISASGTIGTDISATDIIGVSRSGTSSRGAYEFS